MSAGIQCRHEKAGGVKGVASEMLRQLLATERAKTVEKLLLTCDEENAPSEKTILKNGGVFESVVEVNRNRPRKKRFWITIRGES